MENQTTGTPEKTLEPEPEPQAAEPQPKEPEPVEPEPVEPGSQLEESLPAEPELDLTDEEKAPQPEEPLPTNGMPVPVPVTESDDATAGPAVAAQISKAHGKFDLKRIILIATGIFVPPAALVLFWVWKRPKSKVPRIVLTLLLAVYALLWCGGFVSSCSASMEQSRLESLVQADANLDATYEGDGVTIHYPSSWTQFDAGNWGVAYASQTGNRFEYGEAKSVWPALDAAKYNLKYEHGFEQLVSDLTTNLKASTRGMTLDKTSIDVRDNVMVAKTPFVVSDGSSNSCDGTLVVYCDGDGKYRELHLPGHDRYGEDQSQGLHQNGRKSCHGRHTEQKAVNHRRQDGREQADFPAAFECSHQSKKVDRQENQAAVRDEVAELGNQDIAAHESRCSEVSTVIAECVFVRCEYCC